MVFDKIISYLYGEPNLCQPYEHDNELEQECCVKIYFRSHHRTIVLVVLTLLSVPFVSSAQSLYLSPGQNAVSLSTFFSTNQRMSGFHGVSGFSINGFIDLGIGVGHSSVAEKVFDYDVSAFNIQPYFLFCIYKSQKDEFPISFAVEVAYDHYDYLNPVLDVQKTISFAGNFYTFDVMGYEKISLSERVSLQPMVSIGYVSGNSELINKIGRVFSTQYYSSRVEVSVDGIVQHVEEYLYHIKPSVTLSRETPTYALTVGIVIMSVD